EPCFPSSILSAGQVLFANDFRDDYAMPLLRVLMAQIVAAMFGPDYRGTILDADSPRPATSTLSDLQLITEWDCDGVTDKKNGFDFEAGYWKDRHGREGRGTIYAFDDVFDQIDLLHAFKFYLVRGVGEAEKLTEMNPRVIRFDIVQEGSGEELTAAGDGEDSELVFGAKEYTEVMRRRCINPIIAWRMEMYK
ncbi:hypothetical protein C8A00DRAFT_16342, partial [Chaetomidium leptoderma]